jgi:hypothetical protein
MEAASGESCTSTRLQRTSSVVVPFSSFHTMTSAWHWGHHCHTQHGDDAFSSLVRQAVLAARLAGSIGVRRDAPWCRPRRCVGGTSPRRQRRRRTPGG